MTVIIMLVMGTLNVGLGVYFDSTYLKTIGHIWWVGAIIVGQINKK